MVPLGPIGNASDGLIQCLHVALAAQVYYRRCSVTGSILSTGVFIKAQSGVFVHQLRHRWYTAHPFLWLQYNKHHHTWVDQRPQELMRSL